MRTNNRDREAPPEIQGQEKQISRRLREDPVTDEPREASVSKYRDQPLGVCLLLTIADLRELDITVEDTRVVQYWVDSEDNQLKISPQED